MMLQKCPKCGSSRIRRGYKKTPFPMRLFGIYRLLCDHCNLLFTGFVVPGSLNRRKKHRRNKKAEHQRDSPISPSPVN